MKAIKAVILAGGLGTRLWPFTQIVPKPMLPVGDRSILEIQIEHLKKYNVTDITFAVNYKADLLQSYFGDGKRFGVQLSYSLEEKELGTCGPILLLKGKLHEPFIVMNGDILSNINLKKAYDFHSAKKALLTVVSKKLTFPLSYGNIVTDGDIVVQIKEKPDVRVEIAAGIYIMSPGIFEYIPYNKHFGMDELIHTLVKRQVPVHRYKMKEYWLDIGKMEDYEKAQKDYEIILNNDDI